MSEIIYISQKLSKVEYGHKVYNQLINALGDQIKPIENHSDNIWCRDYLPVKLSNGSYVQFKYLPAYMRGMKKYEKMFPNPNLLHEELGLTHVVFTDIILDGGNVELHGHTAIVTDRVFRDNDCSSYSEKEKLKNKLLQLLQIEQLIVVPQYPFDFTGHIDGLVRFVNNQTLITNDYSQEIASISKENPAKYKLMDQWFHSFMDVLLNTNLNVETLTYTPDLDMHDYNNAKGVYMNFLKLEDKIIMPTFEELENDNRAADRLEALYQLPVVQIQAKELATQGGIINCVTWV